MAEVPDETVVPPREHPRVDDERDGGGQQVAHRLAQLAGEVDELRADMDQLRRVLRAVGAVLAPDLLRASRDAATEVS